MGTIPEPLRQAVRDSIGPDLARYLEGRPRDMGEDARDPNELAMEGWRLVPRLMAGLSDPDISAEWMGRRISAPVVAGAYAADLILDPAGVLPIARATASLGLPIVISEECLTPLDAIAAANPNFAVQLRGAGEIDRAIVLARHAGEAGAAGIVLTGLAPAHPRPGLFPGGVDIQSETRRRGLKTVASRGDPREVSAMPGWAWDDLASFCSAADDLGLPVQLKGVLHPADAEAAVTAGCAGVVVSNLGVRNLSRWLPAVSALTPVASAVRGRTSVAIDGGIRNAPDAIVAGCLGADLVTLVRPLVYRSISGGEAAVRDFLSTFIEDISTICFWMGAPGFDALCPDHVMKV